MSGLLVDWVTLKVSLIVMKALESELTCCTIPAKVESTELVLVKN